MQLLTDRLAERLSAHIPTQNEIVTGSGGRGDHDLNANRWVDVLDRKEPRAAAVLVPIVAREAEPTLLLTERTEHLPSHAGQVAFPGGKMEEADNSPVETALREAQEEVGLDPSFVDVIGVLDIYETGTGFRILPVVASVRVGFTLVPHEGEVAEIFEVPLSFLMNPDNHERHSVMWRGRRREYYAMPYEGHYIWGATAGMIVNLYDRVFK